MKRFCLGSCLAALIISFSTNNVLADETNNFLDDFDPVKKMNKTIQEEETILKKLKGLQASFESGVINEEQLDTMIIQIKAGNNPSKLSFYYELVTPNTVGQYSKDATKVMVPNGFRLVKDPYTSLSNEKCLEDAAENRAEMENCRDGLVKMVDNKLNGVFNQLKFNCKQVGNNCDKALLDAQRAWIKYRESTYKFMQTFIGIYESTTVPQQRFWLNELVKQENLLEEINDLLQEVHK